MNDAIQDWEGRIEAMRATPLFSQVGRRDLERIAAAATERRFGTGEEIVTQDQEGDSIYIITEGDADVLDYGTHRATLHRGDFVGEMAVLRRMPHSATVRANTDVTTLRITQWDLDAELRNTPTIAIHMLVSMANRLHLANLQLAQLQDAYYHV